MGRPQFTSGYACLRLAHAPAHPWPPRRTAEGGGPHRVHDVRVLVPRDDGLEHHPPDHAVEVHHQSRRRQPSLCAAGRRLHHRPPDGGLRVADRQAPAAVGPADRPGGPGWRADRLLVPVPDAGDVGLGRVLRHRADPRPPAHQPVLDGRQRRLRSAAGEAAVRVHRRRGPARRHRGLGAGVVRAADRIDQPAAAQRRLHAVVRRARRGDHQARAGRGGSDRLGEGGEGRQRRRSASICCAARSTCRSSRSSSASRPSARHHRAAAEHGGRRPRKARGATDRLPRFWRRSACGRRRSVSSSRSG